ncbi:MAG: DNA-directed RNA polymerase subunit beta' [bacterium]
MLRPTDAREKTPVEFSVIRIQIASPETIRQWSYGEVVKPETINYRSFKPERDGLFCERIFGPVKDWECNCGKYKRIRYRGVICDKCKVEVTQAKVRRERLGHIELAVPVSHIWYFKGIPSRMGQLLDLSVREIERVLYYESYIVIDPADTPLKKKQLLSEEEYLDWEDKYPGKFTAEMGAGSVKKLLKEIDLEELSTELRARVRMETSAQRKRETLKRLKIVEAFRLSGNRPEWMIMDVIPVLPPDLRPLVPLEGGRFATSDLNDLYRRVINRNNRLKKLVEIRAPEVILRNEKRMLQEAVDALFDNGRRSRAVRGPGNRPLKSLSDMLKGKQGRFRQNLLGKRVDYSGRSVIVVGPELKIHQCGLPKSMALELFKPFIIKKLEDRGYVQTVKSAKKLVERERPEVWDILEEIIKDHPVLLNRAPTLHRLGIQAFEPVLVEGKAITIHPLVCQAFNADFDGDQMAVHVPLSFEAQLESRVLMLSINNILSPASGRPLASPSQDMVLGCFYLTKERHVAEGEKPKLFSDSDEVMLAYEHKAVGLHDPVKVRVKGQIVTSTVGRVFFNDIVPSELGFVNYALDKKALEALVGDCHRLLGSYKTAVFLDRLKEIGFEYATRAGLTVGVDDVVVPDEKPKILERAGRAVARISETYRKGAITDGERYNQVIDVWTNATSRIGDLMFENLSRVAGGFNPIYMMAASGARGSKEQIRQLAGMRGLMAKPQKKMTGQMGEIIETPITSNFKEGLTVLEYFISTHGARKGLADTALKTADAGYLTRRLVDVAQDAIINEDDCGTILGLDVTALKEGEEIIEPLGDRILGRVAAEDVYDPITNELIASAGEEIAEKAAEAMDSSAMEKIKIRSVLTCESSRGICAKCYGRNLATGRMVNLGEAVGVIAAQSIGEPGTQLTLRTFHIGGTAGRIAEESKIGAKCDGVVKFQGVRAVDYKEGQRVVLSSKGEIHLYEDKVLRIRYTVPYGAKLVTQDKQQVKQGDALFEWDPYSAPILAEKTGTVRFIDIIDELTVRDELDEKTGLRQRVVVEHRDKNIHPHIVLEDAKGKKVADYPIPTGAHLMLHDGDQVVGGDLLAKIPREIAKTRDITGGLPRVAELFEARKPKERATVSEIDGVVEFRGSARGMRRVVVKGDTGEEMEYLVPHGKHMRVRDQDTVRAGDKLSEGPINPHDILRIKGINAVQEYLVDEIQEVYRLQGVRINDKHIEVIVRQMLEKVRIEDPGETNFLEGEQVDKVRVREENEKVASKGGRPATFQPLLLGITKASLSTESFISAASFQETTRVLTEAAINGATDRLMGLKENVIIGHLIPAGTGIGRNRRIRVIAEEEEIPEMPEEGEEKEEEEVAEA